MLRILFVGCGGCVGAICRYLLGGWIHQILDNPWYPIGTAVINILGCLLIGLCSGLADAREIFSPEARLFLFIGFLGGFTTFSTFSYETVALLRDAQFLAAGTNMTVQVAFGIGSVFLGYTIGSMVI